MVLDQEARRRARTVIQVLALIDMIGVSMVIPVLPDLAIKLGATPATNGLIGTFYGIGQLVGAPISGSISDKHGRKIVLIFSFIDCALSYGLLAFAESFEMLLFCRVLVGLGKQTMTTSQAFITDLTTNEERTTSLGRLQTFFGVGFIVGPLIGSLLSRLHPKLPLLASSFVFFALSIAGFFFLPESKPKIAHAKIAPQTSQSWASKLQTARRQIFSPVGHILLVKFFFSALHTVIQDGFLLFTRTKFGFDSKSNGPLLSYMGILTALAHSQGVPIFLRYLSEQNTVISTTLFGGIFNFVMGGSDDLAIFLIALGGSVVVQGVLSTCLSSAYSKVVPVDQRGGYMGLTSSLDAIVRITVPTVSGLLLQFHPSAPFLLTGTSFILLATYLAASPIRVPEHEPKIIYEKHSHPNPNPGHEKDLAIKSD